jgi:phosphoribosylformylglycinamidine cyclo-ligase
MGGMTYKDAGVDIDKKSAALAGIGGLVKSTFGPGVLHELGSFGGMYSGRFEGLDDPVLVATNDGVGTKVRTALMAGRPRGLGHDIVNHCVDDILVQGARPLFFFDYVASSVLVPETFTELVAGLAEACRACGAALLGGETAEMPGVYAEGELDLVGFIVGVVDRADVWPRGVAAGDVLLGVRSNGLHTNGFSLVNRLIERDGLDLARDPGGLGESLADALLRPHRSYLAPVMALREEVDVHALAHITGGGLKDNLPRVLPEGVGATIDRRAWTPNPVFRFLVERAEMPAAEAYHVFNMGCGLVVAVGAADADRAIEVLAANGEEAWRIGELVEGRGVAFTDGM